MEPLHGSEGYVDDENVRLTSIPMELFISLWSYLQGSDVSYEEAQSLVHEVVPTVLSQVYSVSFHTFVSIVCQKSNDAFDLVKLTRYQDMTRPLSHYFISASHKTYIEGNKYPTSTSTSTWGNMGKISVSVNRYVNDLCKGCRYVEVICWDGTGSGTGGVTAGGDPVVCVDPYSVSKIAFIDVIVAIKTFGFKTSPYPIILSIDNHCSPEQQKRMTDILIAVLGRMLLMPGDMTTEEGHLPSPEQAKYKVFIMSTKKGKRRKRRNQQQQQRQQRQQQDVMMTPGSTELEQQETSLYDDVEDEFDDEDDVEESVDDNTIASESSSTLKENRKPFATSNELDVDVEFEVHPEYAGIIYFDTYKWRNMSTITACDRVATVTERQSQSFLDTNESLGGIISWTQDNIRDRDRDRGDPPSSPSPYSSSDANPDPIAGWATGNQIVALNHQFPGFPLQLNDCKFRENGSCGYVLKPGYMISPVAVVEPGVQLVVHILSAQQLPKSPQSSVTEGMNPFLTVTLSGLPCDATEERTAVVSNNNFNPVWDEVAQLTFRVYDQTETANNFIAYTSIPLACIRPGMRTLSLYDEKGLQKGDYAYASICLRISFHPLQEAEN
eukprot:gene3751-7445_t